MTPKKMNRLLLVAIGLIAIGIIIGLFIANKSVSNVAAQTAQNRAEIEITSAKISSYQLTQAKIGSLGYVEELANTVLPSGRDESAIVAELSQFALRARLSVAEITFTEKNVPTKSKQGAGIVAPKGVDVVPVEVKLKSGAKFENLLEFLRSIENNRRAMQVTSIMLTPDEENRSLLSGITVSINLYSKKAGG